MDQIEQRLVSIVEKDFDFKNKKSVSLDSELKDDLGLDSLSLTELVIACEDEFGIEIDIDESNVNKSARLRDLCEEIKRLVNES